mgnify:CR=1 FL=1
MYLLMCDMVNFSIHLSKRFRRKKVMQFSKLSEIPDNSDEITYNQTQIDLK